MTLTFVQANTEIVIRRGARGTPYSFPYTRSDGTTIQVKHPDGEYYDGLLDLQAFGVSLFDDPLIVQTVATDNLKDSRNVIYAPAGRYSGGLYDDHYSEVYDEYIWLQNPELGIGLNTGVYLHLGSNTLSALSWACQMLYRTDYNELSDRMKSGGYRFEGRRPFRGATEVKPSHYIDVRIYGDALPPESEYSSHGFSFY